MALVNSDCGYAFKIRFAYITDMHPCFYGYCQLSNARNAVLQTKELESIMLSAMSQSEKDKNYIPYFAMHNVHFLNQIF